MPVYLPLFFKSDSMNCLVVGGGEVAVRKIEILRDYGCDVTIIAPEINGEPIELSGNARWVMRKYRAGDCAGYSLVIAGTGDRSVNRAVSEEAQSLGIPVNVIDDPELCTVIFSANHKDQDLCIAVSTGGQAPFMAARLRNTIREQADGWGDWISLAGEFREVVRNEKLTVIEQNNLLQRFTTVNPIPTEIDPPQDRSLQGWLDWLDGLQRNNRDE